MVLAAIGLSTVSASAQLILGFELDDTSSNNLEVNLGSLSNFTTTTPLETVISGSTLSLDLGASNAYGSSWATSADLVWGVAGAAGSTKIDVTYDVVDNGAPPTLFSSDVSTASGPIGGLLTTYNDNSASSTEHTSNAVLITSSSTNPSGAWTAAEGGVGRSNDFDELNAYTTEDTDGSPEYSIGLYQFTGSTPTKLGTFTLDSSGNLTYVGVSPTVVPEPSTYALFASGALLLFVALRRRKTVA